MERVKFIHRTTNTTALAEQFIEGREIYVGVMGNDRVTVLPPWEFVMTKKEDRAPLIASGRAKWDPEYQRHVGLKTGPACLSKKMQAKLADLSKEIYRLLGMDEDFALSAKYVGINYPALIEQLIQFGMKYAPSRIIA